MKLRPWQSLEVITAACSMVSAVAALLLVIVNKRD
jgi:hypothetical protein